MTEPANDDLRQLYPFLYGGRKSGTALLESIRQKCDESIAVKKQFFEKNGEALLNAASLIADVYAGNGRMFAMGNGGSSCDAAHFAVEFQHPVTAGRPALPAINLSADVAMMTAVANDVGIEHVFVRQIEALAKAGDGLIGFSTSGNSKNLLEGFRKAKELRVSTIAVIGGDGGLIKSSKHVDCCLLVETDSIHRVQEVHVAIYHIIWDLVHTMLADRRGKLAEGTVL